MSWKDDEKTPPPPPDTPSENTPPENTQDGDTLDDKTLEDLGSWIHRFKRKPTFWKLFYLSLAGGAFLGLSIITYVIHLYINLPSLDPIKNYSPQLVSTVYDRHGNVVSTFFKEKRRVVDLQDIPQHVIQAFVSAEDSSFLNHSGVKYKAIFRALLTNLKAGRKVQGASTITQQVAKIFLLTSEKTYTRKVKELFLAKKIENTLTKQEILYLYLNQIYLGNGAYGVAQAAQTYFKKDVSKINLAEAALLSGLLQAPSRYSPSKNPSAAKKRQLYVLGQMISEGVIDQNEFDAAKNTPIDIYPYIPPRSQAPYVKSLIQQIVSQVLESEDTLLEEGLEIYTTLDLEQQKMAQKSLEEGLKEVDKRQGYRGPLMSLKTEADKNDFLISNLKALINKIKIKRILLPNGSFPEEPLLDALHTNTIEQLPEYLSKENTAKALVTKVDDRWGVTTLQVGEYEGLIDIDSMTWARSPNPRRFYKLDVIKKPSQALQAGDVVLVKVVAKQFKSKRLDSPLEDYRPFNTYLHLELEQEPKVQGALLSLSPKHDEVFSLVGGYSFSKSQFNRVFQAKRQTGSVFKPVVYMAALDYGLLPNTKILDAPIVFKKKSEEEISGNPQKENSKEENLDKEEGAEAEASQFSDRWKPQNSSDKFSGQILLRNALVRSKNIPTIKLSKKMGVQWIASYARRLGIASPLNPDLTLGLGSSSISLYEVTKVFAQIARMGLKSSPIFIKSVKSKDGDILMENISLDYFMKKELENNQVKIDLLEAAFDEYQKYVNRYNETSESIPKSIEVIHPKTGKSVKILNKDIPQFFYPNPDQLVSPQTAYILLSMLKGVISDRFGTGRRAASLRHTAFGKTGTTNNYFDAWFVGSTPHITTGVWVGLDNERSLGRGEVGSRSALPIWLNYMKFAHKNLRQEDFPIPKNIITTNIDAKTGLLPSKSSDHIFEQAFVKGSEPSKKGEEFSLEEENFLKGGL